MPKSGALICSYNSCQEAGVWRCSNCKDSYYCSRKHQRMHWQYHKERCRESATGHSLLQSSMLEKGKQKEDQGEPKAEYKGQQGETRTCRCMFCGKELLLQSEGEAVGHMEVCGALQEQLASSECITIPSEMKKQMQIDL